MNQLDRLIERLQDGQEYLLESKKEICIKTPDSLKGVGTGQTLSAPQIITLLSEIAPAEIKGDLRGGRESRFEYRLKDRNYDVFFRVDGDVVQSKIAPASARPQAVPAAPKAASGEPEMNALFRKMVEMGASDLHMTSNHRPMIRESGEMAELPGNPELDAGRIRRMLYEIMPKQNAAQFEASRDTDFPYEIPGLARFRANIFMDRHGMGAVFRQIPVDIVTAEKLGLSKEILDLCSLTKGLVLVTGPTGSGKSTTLCSLIDYINRNRKLHIITIEDPIEFVHPKKQCLVNQREVHVHTNSFASALRAALREDPDIILVGEMRDLETIAIALETAETGHLVFGTLHTTTAASTVDRIVDQFPADRQAQIRTMLASSLKGVISQTLCRKIGGGRVAAQEVLLVTPAVSNLVREGKVFQIPSIMQTSRALGMVLLNDALFNLVVDKKVEPVEALAKSVDKAGFTAMLKAKGINVNTPA
jgi:twitching motility protein PilT